MNSLLIVPFIVVLFLIYKRYEFVSAWRKNGISCANNGGLPFVGNLFQHLWNPVGFMLAANRDVSKRLHCLSKCSTTENLLLITLEHLYFFVLIRRGERNSILHRKMVQLPNKLTLRNFYVRIYEELVFEYIWR